MSSNHPYDKLELTSFVTGDVSEQKSNLIKEHLQVCEECRNFVQSLKDDQAAFLSQMPFEESNFSQVQEKKEQKFFPFWQISSVAAVLIFALLFTLHKNEDNSALEGQGVTPTIQLKTPGEEFQFFVQDSSEKISQRDKQIYYPNEKIQVCFTSINKEYLMLFSIDSSGKISRYFPSFGDRSIKVETGSGIPLPNSIRLDSYVGPEKYIMILSEEALSASTIEEEIIMSYNRKGFKRLRLPEIEKGASIIKEIEKRGLDAK